MKLPPVCGGKSTTPVKAKTSAPTPDLPLSWLLPSLRRILLPLLRFLYEVSSSSLPRRGIPLGTSVQKLAACTCPIFLFFHFPLVKDIELLGNGEQIFQSSVYM